MCIPWHILFGSLSKLSWFLDGNFLSSVGSVCTRSDTLRYELRRLFLSTLSKVASTNGKRFFDFHVVHSSPSDSERGRSMVSFRWFVTSYPFVQSTNTCDLFFHPGCGSKPIRAMPTMYSSRVWRTMSSFVLSSLNSAVRVCNETKRWDWPQKNELLHLPMVKPTKKQQNPKIWNDLNSYSILILLNASTYSYTQKFGVSFKFFRHPSPFRSRFSVDKEFTSGLPPP